MSSLAQKITGKLSNESQDAASKPPEQALKEFIAVRASPRRHDAAKLCVHRRTRTLTGGGCAAQEDPNSVYTFDSARDAPRSEICREGKEKGRKCIQVRFCSHPPMAALSHRCALGY
ncbi:hypothetical protein ACG7TL_002724 [Trametes sanguinea]